MRRFVRTRTVWASVGFMLVGCGTAAAGSVYVGLGDSITFGETDLRYIPSYGDRGYVSKVADALASANGGTRPTVVNFAIDGETASSFMTGMGRTPPVVGRTDIPLAEQNLNYAHSPTTPQVDMFRGLVSSEKATGNTIDNISITLGFNELAALASLPPSQGLAAIPGTLTTYRSDYTNVLTDVRALEPSAHLYLLGYYNPFPGDPTANPAKPIFAEGGPQLNAIIEGLATEFGATYVDNATPFVGKEGALTYIAQYPAGSISPAPGSGVEPIGDAHANDAGYTVIAGQITATPEPASIGLVGIAAAGFGLLCFRRRSA